MNTRKDMTPTSERWKRGFTLVELLVSFGIIAILAAILIPTVGSVRTSANLSDSQSRIRQILTATHLFSLDHSGHMPKVATDQEYPDGDFFFLMESNGVADLESSALLPYLEDTDIFFAKGDDGLKEDGSPGRNFSYSFNFLINKGILPEGGSGPTDFDKALGTVQYQTVLEPSKKIMVFEEEAPNDAFCVWFMDSDRLTDRYAGKGPVGFVDGHVEVLEPDVVFGNAEYGEFVQQSDQY
ncbi:type II secretion system protein [Rubellicoccus peritrichatus]|uniref:Prepilin-type N-terminal cleavage/methylation domain-containing protein n=1 Tax=Rubellicoccus peritrichatus TaxID=3080537 RepID=A0AAQ3LAE0_9BACT|nr:prepilin-type N-terminal cleavage/methylation domain-containing protein [Puniceicoccus sp. CR14]WOO41786.1 prepilin-type N-terminal cleavage/methylation domain-containing protein [Puniceicoccus sp. CR14]